MSRTTLCFSRTAPIRPSLLNGRRLGDSRTVARLANLLFKGPRLLILAKIELQMDFALRLDIEPGTDDIIIVAFIAAFIAATRL